MKEPFIVVPPEMARVIIGFFIIVGIALVTVMSCDDYNEPGSTAPIYSPQDTIQNIDTTETFTP